MKIVYLHGLASIGTSVKSEALIAAFGADNVFAPDLPLDPIGVVDIISDYVDKLPFDEQIVFVGTSLGGFWANFFAQTTDSYGVLVNPMLIPGDAFVDRIGEQVVNYKTGAVEVFSQDLVDDFKTCQEDAADFFNPKAIVMFLAMDDSVIDYRSTLSQVNGVEYFLTPDGGHRYESNWDLVVNKVKEIVSRPQLW